MLAAHFRGAHKRDVRQVMGNMGMRMALSDVIEGETQAEFVKRVEAFYCYSFKPGEKWTLFGDLLIVVHPDREPIIVREGGQVEQINPAFQGLVAERTR